MRVRSSSSRAALLLICLGSASAFQPSSSAFLCPRSSRSRSRVQPLPSPSSARRPRQPNSGLLRRESTVDDTASEQQPEAVAQREDTRSLLNSVAAINAAAISFFVIGAAYELLHVDIEAALALFYYDDSMEASALAESIDLFLRLPMDSLHNYEALVPTNPIFYKACTSGVAYTIGDFVSQVYQGRTLETLDLKRSARSGAAGFIGHGPLCHFWMIFMETYLDFGGAWWGTGVKVIADQTVWSLYLNAMYSFLIGTLAFRPPGDVWRDVKATSWPALRTSWRFWPFVHTISFSHAVPLDLKLLWVDVMEIVWVTLLSKVANDDKDKTMAATEAKAEKLGEDVLALTNEVGIVDETLSLGEVNPAVAIAMTVELEQQVAQQNADEGPAAWLEGGSGLSKWLTPRGAQVLTAKSFRAGWPLFAMWPFLFAGYQVEQMMALSG